MSKMSDFLEAGLRAAIFRDSPVTVRANSTAYSLGDRVQLGTSDLNLYEVITAGTSAGSPPTFNTNLGDTTTDGGVTWLTLKQGWPKRPLHVSLHTADPTDAGTGTEVSGGSYARVARAPSNANWSGASATDGLTDNAAAITFPAPTANWGTVTHLGIWDRATGGNLITHGVLTTPRVINNGDAAPLFSAGELDITFG